MLYKLPTKHCDNFQIIVIILHCVKWICTSSVVLLWGRFRFSRSGGAPCRGGFRRGVRDTGHAQADHASPSYAVAAPSQEVLQE
ncbi:hypothetical protein WA026_013808 [Henosepilachna vigintioctopunctata]|uniref:Uncharacterized protein n=1 Tax=Henosepilachna vigintioctopunctata TaxID=420089 RepID=A0AAW1UXS4_9CUCU